MDENKPLDLFLQPSRRLLFLSLVFIVSCIILLFSAPIEYVYQLFMFFLMLIGIVRELRLKVFLTSSKSIIRFGYDGGVMDHLGEVNEIRWWYQQRSGEKVYAELSGASRVWVEWVALEFKEKRRLFKPTVLVARDSVENPEDFQRLKRLLRSR